MRAKRCARNQAAEVWLRIGKSKHHVVLLVGVTCVRPASAVRLTTGEKLCASRVRPVSSNSPPVRVDLTSLWPRLIFGASNRECLQRGSEADLRLTSYSCPVCSRRTDIPIALACHAMVLL